MQHVSSLRYESIALSALALAGLPGACCAAPSVEVAGAYFPAWLGCALVAIVIAIVARAVMVATGFAQVLPLQLFVCLSIGLLGAAIVWTACVGL